MSLIFLSDLYFRWEAVRFRSGKRDMSTVLVPFVLEKLLANSPGPHLAVEWAGQAGVLALEALSQTSRVCPCPGQGWSRPHEHSYGELGRGRSTRCPWPGWWAVRLSLSIAKPRAWTHFLNAAQLRPQIPGLGPGWAEHSWHPYLWVLAPFPPLQPPSDGFIS